MSNVINFIRKLNLLVAFFFSSIAVYGVETNDIELAIHREGKKINVSVKNVSTKTVLLGIGRDGLFTKVFRRSGFMGKKIYYHNPDKGTFQAGHISGNLMIPYILEPNKQVMFELKKGSWKSNITNNDLIDDLLNTKVTGSYYGVFGIWLKDKAQDKDLLRDIKVKLN